MSKNRKILIINSDKSKLIKVQGFINEIFSQFNIPKKYFNKVFLCVSEAVVNSIEHGNKNEFNKEVAIHVDCKIKSLDVKVSDEGEGFNYHELEDPTCAENIKNESGRGLHIIKSFSETIKYVYEDKCIQFKINLSE